MYLIKSLVPQKVHIGTIGIILNVPPFSRLRPNTPLVTIKVHEAIYRLLPLESCFPPLYGRSRT